jgi:ribosomal protein S10
MSIKLLITVKSFDLLRGATTSTLSQDNGQSIHSSNQVRSLRLPRKRTLYTVLRSPHIDKKSREQFEMRSYKQLFIIHTNTNRIHNQLLDLKLHSVPGIQVRVVLHYQTRLTK